MAYFPNGAEADEFEANVCVNCAHYGDGKEEGYCPVWTDNNRKGSV
jgi:hypothetical protein